ncbi:MAG: UMP kinase [Acidobacteria bacterium]|nr:UMP kinase [Acidobacteriota bacterium]
MGYQRILLKLSGEVLGGGSGRGFDFELARGVAAGVAEAARQGAGVGIVVGGGNFFRGLGSADSGIERVTVDSMGMLATVVNALGLAGLLRAEGLRAEAFSAVGMEPLAARYDRRAVNALLDDGGVAVFGGGTGNPYFSTDTAAALRAIEIGADLLAKGTKVDGVYDKDPARHPDAKRYAKISYSDVLAQGLGVMDATAVALCRENKMPVLVFDLLAEGAVARVARGESMGTLMS